MMLNCLTAVVLKYSHFERFLQLGSLQLYKDIPIAVFGALLGSYIPRIGYLRSIIYSFYLAIVLCVITPLFNDLWFIKLWFFFIGVCFTITKISVYYIATRLSFVEKKNNRLIQHIEASFMVGVIAVNLLFGLLLNGGNETLWQIGFWIMSGFCLLTVLFLEFGKNAWKKDPAEKRSKRANFKSLIRIKLSRKMSFFLLIILLVIFIEQCFVIWLPAYSNLFFHIDPLYASLTVIVFALFSALGRVLYGYWVLRFQWDILFIRMVYALFAAVVMTLIFLYFAGSNLFLLYLLPVLGFTIGPLYPLINGHQVFKTNEKEANALLGYVMIFTSIGSSLGSLSIGFYFDFIGIKYAYSILVPVILILIILFKVYQRNNRVKND